MTTISENADIFCRAAKARSLELHDAMDDALDKGRLTVAGSLLRMELDSMIRVIWLLSHPDTREQLLESYVSGKGFKAGRTPVRDFEMVDEACSSGGWVRLVYDFGNAFVHLTNMHGYTIVDPFPEYEHRDDVIEYINYFHSGKVPGGPLDGSSTLSDLAAYAPFVLEKVTSNLNFYLEGLREQCI